MSNTIDAHLALSALSSRFHQLHGRAPVIGLDLDGTTADLVGTLRDQVAEELGIPAHQALERLPDPDQYLMWEGDTAWFQDKDHFKEIFTLSEARGIYRELDPYHGAKDVLQTLVNHGFVLRVVTARPENYNPDTRFWLERHGIPVVEILNPGMAKHEVEDIDVFIEDCPDIVENIAALGRPVLVFHQSYNSDITDTQNIRRLPSWSLPAVAQALDHVLSSGK